ncbi:MAG: 50S ribosomal protein L23 [Bacteroidales bacterium]|nr:50S ribosomal protein L23 [Bacteroidales bacterium]
MKLEILHRPVVTEKFTKLGEKLNKYAFIVNRKANKLEIKKAVEEMYDVEIAEVNTMQYAGKNKSRSTKTGVVKGKTKAFKKAIVTLKEGEKIDFYSNI